MDDWQCLSQYVHEGSQSAFREVVARHVDLVYTTCRRVVRDAHLAEDATQAVFVILAKKARTIRRNTSLVGWLHNTARYVSSNAMRVAANRRRHEMEAAQMPGYMRSAEEKSNHAAEDVVDRALNRLEAQERDAILLRFFEGRSFREVGVALSISEEAAKKRVWRGIEKLRQMLTPSGSAAPAAATIAGILAAAHQAPATLASVAAATALTGTGAAISLAKGAVIAMAISKTKATAVGMLMLILLGGGAAVVVRDIVNRPKTVSYSIPASKPATQPLWEATTDTQPATNFVSEALLKIPEQTGDVTLVAAPACSHLEKHADAANAACTSCHIGTNKEQATVQLGKVVHARLTGDVVLWADRATPTVTGDALWLANGANTKVLLLNAADGKLLNLVDTNGLAAGTDAPAIDMKQMDGTKLNLADLKGKYVLVHFWDSKSKESADQMPHLRAAKRDWADEPKLVMVGINVDEKAEAATAFAREQKMEWMQGMAGAGSNLMQQYHVGVGAAVLIGPDGKIVAGSLQGLAIDDALDKALRRQ